MNGAVRENTIAGMKGRLRENYNWDEGVSERELLYSWGEGASEREWSGVCAECVRENYSWG
jgi:hypothetical protein